MYCGGKWSCIRKIGNMIVLGEQQRDRVMYPFSPKLPSHPDCCITLSRVPCAI